MQYSHADVIVSANKLQTSCKRSKRKERILKLNYSSTKSSRFLKFICSAERIRIRMLHRSNPRTQFQNDIFDVKTRCETLFFIQLWTGPPATCFYFRKCIYDCADRVNICNSRFIIFCICVMSLFHKRVYTSPVTSNTLLPQVLELFWCSRI